MEIKYEIINESKYDIDPVRLQSRYNIHNNYKKISVDNLNDEQMTAYKKAEDYTQPFFTFTLEIINNDEYIRSSSPYSNDCFIINVNTLEWDTVDNVIYNPKQQIES